jgi:RNA polymerase sigma factor (sigma-70 family)
MTTTEKESAAQTNDAELVAESLAGGRDGFRQIVERHQTLVCSLAYCATGSLTQSEDLAQETFLAAWRQLAELREPSKLRPWLCGIARFVIGKELRRQGREHVHAAEMLETVNELAAPEPLPSERAISKEEQAILWHCVARIPEIYREALVLFYREQQSIERVAAALELSEDAVKQRLARGRKLLQEQTLAYVEGALQSTNPGKAFTVGVLAVLPLSATSAKAATAGMAIKGSSTAKTVMGMATLGAMILFSSLLTFLAFVGGCAGYWMSRAFAVILVIPHLFLASFSSSNLAWRFAGHLPDFVVRCWGWTIMNFQPKLRLDSFCTLVVAALAIWMLSWWRDLSRQEADAQEHGKRLKRRFVLWLSLGMVGPAGLLALVIGLMCCPTPGPVVQQHVSDAEVHAEVQKILAGSKVGEWGTQVRINYLAGTKTLSILPAIGGTRSEAKIQSWVQDIITKEKAVGWTVNKEGTKALRLYPDGIGRIAFWAVENESRLMEQDKNRAVRPAIASLRDSRETWPFEWMLPFFIAPMGAMILLRQIRKGQWKTTAPGIAESFEQDFSKYGRMQLELRTDALARRVFASAFAAVFLLAFGANAITAMGLYVVIFVGSVKGAFLGLVAGIGVLYLRTQRKVSKACVNL